MPGVRATHCMASVGWSPVTPQSRSRTAVGDSGRSKMTRRYVLSGLDIRRPRPVPVLGSRRAASTIVAGGGPGDEGVAKEDRRSGPLLASGGREPPVKNDIWITDRGCPSSLGRPARGINQAGMSNPHSSITRSTRPCFPSASPGQSRLESLPSDPRSGADSRRAAGRSGRRRGSSSEAASRPGVRRGSDREGRCPTPGAAGPPRPGPDPCRPGPSGTSNRRIGWKPRTLPDLGASERFGGTRLG